MTTPETAPADPSSAGAVRISVGDAVQLWIGPPKRGGMRSGRVIGIDNRGHSGIEIRFDAPVNGCDTCYATHDEVALA